MKGNFNQKMVSAIRANLPFGENIVIFLMDLLGLERESVYRRIKGDIPFSFAEVVKIASELDLSIDNIIQLQKQHDRIIFDLILGQVENSESFYYEKIQRFIQFYIDVHKSSIAKSIFSANYIPYSFSLYCKEFTKFSYYKWAHRIQIIKPNFKMADIVTPQKILDLQEAWFKEDSHTVNATYILDQNIFLSALKDIDYFYKRQLINDNELAQIQAELLDLIDGMILLANTGLSRTGAEVYMYLSPLDVNSNYSYFEYDNYVSCHTLIYDTDVLHSYDALTCLAQKEWLETLKRYSTLITHCGETERFTFFSKQQDYILNLGKI